MDFNRTVRWTLPDGTTRDIGMHWQEDDGQLLGGYRSPTGTWFVEHRAVLRLLDDIATGRTEASAVLEAVTEAVDTPPRDDTQ